MKIWIRHSRDRFFFNQLFFHTIFLLTSILKILTLEIVIKYIPEVFKMVCIIKEIYIYIYNDNNFIYSCFNYNKGGSYKIRIRSYCYSMRGVNSSVGSWQGVILNHLNLHAGIYIVYSDHSPPPSLALADCHSYSYSTTKKEWHSLSTILLF